ncbi:hypothetical protein BHU72_00210 [Desulfuribacillus stibiiarsenatis]|uniref:6-hydroxymethylpterin diphosphokinase MptE-like domain-containing protein n=1 Tax=Desulfuribacillus stibiiarsenatis TaxID=1390249 RepID=A0A1E5L9B0_9FIRM|nr:6-hydroxymethylpterin diphosphokinase MptE-like protein [Desulfuribacillus stibiiarsenatis]OEH86735.1 hypothetical protein BHU72_00210 [Desulfuribacillus stibiiarsenatis]
MFLQENLKLLKAFNSDLYEFAKKDNEYIGSDAANIITSKIGIPSLQIHRENKNMLIHSKYDPLKEAESLIERSSEEIKQYTHVLFYGMGLGYHIEYFAKAYPDKRISIYEPNQSVFNAFLNSNSLNKFPLKNIEFFYIESAESDSNAFLQNLAYQMYEPVMLFVLPSYQQVFPDNIQNFTKCFIEIIRNQKLQYKVQLAFGKRWVINSLFNLRETFNSKNIFNDTDKYFRNKPVVVVSAGPSLEEEYENLRYIKENHLAFIFSVGSAYKALLAQKIIPDAILTYDPQKHNYEVFSMLYHQNITQVPLIYGTSVGFETLEMYKGPKMHFFTSADTVSNYYLKDINSKSTKVINDAPTIAAITMQIVAELGANPVILVGQNLGFKDNKFYAGEVEYHSRTSSIVAEDLEDLIEVEDVNGDKIATNRGFNTMRKDLETYIASYPNLKVINTTRGGVKIAGTIYQELTEVIHKELLNSNLSIEINEWHHTPELPSYDNVCIKDKVESMEYSIHNFRIQYRKINKLIHKMRKTNILQNDKDIRTNIAAVNNEVKSLLDTDFFKVYLSLPLKYHTENLVKRILGLQFIDDLQVKSPKILGYITSYLDYVKQTSEELIPYIQVASKQVTDKHNENNLYLSDSGVFSYEGKWNSHNYLNVKSDNLRLIEYYTNEIGSKLKFNFQGKSLRLLGSLRSDRTSKIKLILDGNTYDLSEQNAIDKEDTPKLMSEFFKVDNLDKGRTHSVEIETLDDNIFTFYGADTDGRLFHLDEVTDIKDLDLGKRIRCHYRANYNQVGEFGVLGEKVKDFIHPEATAYPDGDFYFIMVDIDESGNKKMIADRNVQHSISWETLNKKNMVFGDKSENPSYRLLTGGQAPMDQNGNAYEGITDNKWAWPTTNEWDSYIYSDIFNESIWNCQSIGSWCQEQSLFSFGIRDIDNYKVVRGPVISDKHKKVITFSVFTIVGVNHLRGYRPVSIINLEK